MKSTITVSLVSALGIGIYFAYKDRKRKDDETYYFGNKTMAPVSFSYVRVIKLVV